MAGETIGSENPNSRRTITAKDNGFGVERKAARKTSRRAAYALAA